MYTNLRKQGHKVVGVFTVPDKDGKADPLGECQMGGGALNGFCYCSVSWGLGSHICNVVQLYFKCHRSGSERWETEMRNPCPTPRIPLIKCFRFVDNHCCNRKWGWTPVSYFSHNTEFLSSALAHNSTVCECLCLHEAQGQFSVGQRRRSTCCIMISLFWWIVVWSHVRWKVLQWSEHLWSTALFTPGIKIQV